MTACNAHIHSYMSLGKTSRALFAHHMLLGKIHWFVKVNIADYKQSHESVLEMFSILMGIYCMREGSKHNITIVFRVYSLVLRLYTLPPSLSSSPHKSLSTRLVVCVVS